MRVLRGRAADPEADAAVTRELVARADEDRESGLRVWRPHRQLSFGRRDAREDGYERAREIAIREGYPPTERSVGGRAVAYTGSTVAVAFAEPIGEFPAGIEERYDRVTQGLQRSLWRLAVPAQRGEPDDSFCPGGHALQWDGKIAGVAQRVRRGVALVAGVVIVRDHVPIGGVLDPVYEALGVPFDPTTVGSIARAGGRDDPNAVTETIEDVLVGDRSVSVRQVEEDSTASREDGDDSGGSAVNRKG